MNNARELSSRLLDLLRREQGAMSEFLLALADFDRSRAWVALGYTSLFYYLHRELKLSAGAAFHRKTAAVLIQRFPEVAEPLRDGRLCLSSVCELAKVLTPENRSELLPRFFHASKQEAKAVAAEVAPREVVPQRVVVTAIARTSPASATDPGAGPLLLEPAPVAPGDLFHPGETQSATACQARPRPVPPVAAPRASAEPLTADLRRLHMTVSKRFMEKLEAAKDALSHSHPGAEVEAILEAGLDLVIERAAKRRGCTRPRNEKGAPAVAVENCGPVMEGSVMDGTGERGAPRKYAGGPRFIPAAVKREVWLRDGGRCQFRLVSGERCGSTHRVQFDHVRPVALGGQSTVGNLRLACSAHNLLAARRVFGDALMDRYAPNRPSPGHRGELLDDWARARAGQPVVPIPPLDP